jgi:hypothetical protein
MAEQTDAAIPESVLTTLEDVRAGGETNMMARDTVIAIILRDADEAMDEAAYREAAMWLYDNKGRYMEALRAMGERRTKVS